MEIIVGGVTGGSFWTIGLQDRWERVQNRWK